MRYRGFPYAPAYAYRSLGLLPFEWREHSPDLQGHYAGVSEMIQREFSQRLARGACSQGLGRIIWKVWGDHGRDSLAWSSTKGHNRLKGGFPEASAARGAFEWLTVSWWQSQMRHISFFQSLPGWTYCISWFNCLPLSYCLPVVDILATGIILLFYY